MTSEQLDTIRGHVNDLLEQLVPELTGLTDAWDFTDASLCSALGMYDGNVYENIMRWVEQMPINKDEVHNDGNGVLIRFSNRKRSCRLDVNDRRGEESEAVVQ